MEKCEHQFERNTVYENDKNWFVCSKCKERIPLIKDSK